MHHAVTIVIVVDLLVCLYALALCAAAGRETPKPPKAGKDFDERGPY
jgi:hypothetical protein